MNLKIGKYASLVNIISVALFAISMLLGLSFGAYFVCMFIAFSYICMACSFDYFANEETKVASKIGVCFACLYAVFTLLVYFAQVTAVSRGGLSNEVMAILDYQKFGLFFSYDLLGYGFMAVSTFFIGLTINVKSVSDRWLKGLLLVHGIFAVACFLLPILGVFSPDMVGAEWIGTAVLIVWCIYFIPIGVLSYKRFAL